MADAGQNKNRNKDMGSNVGQTASAAAERASEVASNVGQRAEEAAGAATERANEALASVGQGMSSLGGSLRHNAPNQGMLGSAAGTLADTLEAGGEYLQEHDLADIGDDLRGFVRQYPLGSLLCVFGLGLLMGRALGR